MTDVLVVGAGISGVACARTLAAAGADVTVLDRGRRVGGRMASRTLQGRPVDIGASYFTVTDPAFEAVVAGWRERGLARPWTDTFTVLTGGGTDPSSGTRIRTETRTGPLRWAAPGGLRTLVEDLAAGLRVESGVPVQSVLHDDRLRADGRTAEAVVLAMPDPQAARLLGPGLEAARHRLDRAFEPVLALTAVFAERAWDLDGAFVHDHPALAWLADDGRRRGDGAAVLVAHSTPQLAGRHLDQPDTAIGPMVAALRELLDLPEPATAQLHRWSFAKPAAGRDRPFLLTAPGLGACGDAWTPKPRVEGAYLSGVALGEALLDQLS